MILKADGGSTKVEWVLLSDESENAKEIEHFVSAGINPSLQDEEALMTEIQKVVAEHGAMNKAEKVLFYGAGCTPMASPKLAKCLRQSLPSASAVVVDSDIIGAAQALFGNREGIACILGTGACSCQWGKDGSGIVRQTPSLGYILGDEGSGAVLGRMLVNALYKGRLPESLRRQFEEEYSIDMYGIIDKVYRQPSPNRWLASLSHFVSRHLDVPEIEELVRENMRSFFVRNILPYQRPDLDVSFVGSIAYHYQHILRSEADALDIKIGKVMKSPLQAE